MSKKYLVINGLIRSGTNMLERLIDSQDNMMCIGGLFETPKTILGILDRFEKYALIETDFTSGDLVLDETHRHKLKNELMRNICSKMLLFHSHEFFENKTGVAQTVYGLSINQYNCILERIIRDDMPENRNPLEYFSDCVPDINLIAAKWTSCHAYAPAFVKNSDCYWLEILRNPRDRFVSARLSHKDDVFHASRFSGHCLQFASTFSHSRYKTVLYEDMCSDSSSQIKDISEWLGLKIDEVELINPYGDPFKPNTSKNITKDKSYKHQDKNQSSVVKNIDHEWKKNYISSTEEEIICKIVGENRFYKINHGKPLDKFYALTRIYFYQFKNFISALSSFSARILRKYIN